MQLIFDNIDEVHDFVSKLKKTRGGKDKDESEAGATQGTQQAPPPLAPPTGGNVNTGGAAGGGFPSGGFGAGATAQIGGAFPAHAQVAPEVQGLVTRIMGRYRAAIASGQPAEQALTWLRAQCGPEAGTGTAEQIEQYVMVKLPVAQLEGMAKLMNA